MKPWLKRRKNLEFCETLLPDLRLEEEYNYNILLRMTSENSKEIFQLINDISTENAKLRGLILPRLQLLSTGYNFYQQRSYTRVMVMSIILRNQLKSSTFTSFPLSSSSFFLLWWSLLFFYFPQKLYIKNKSPDLSLYEGHSLKFKIGTPETSPFLIIFYFFAIFYHFFLICFFYLLF